jgi:hypothetical protein
VRLNILKRTLLVYAGVALLASCNSPSTNPESASNGNSNNSTGEQRRSTSSPTPAPEETVLSAPPLQPEETSQLEETDGVAGSSESEILEAERVRSLYNHNRLVENPGRYRGTGVEAVGVVDREGNVVEDCIGLWTPPPGLWWGAAVCTEDPDLLEELEQLSKGDYLRVQGVFLDTVENIRVNERGALIGLTDIETTDKATTLDPTVRTFKPLTGPYGASIEGFINEYYAAIEDATGYDSRGYWSTTYVMLDKASQEKFTLEEWENAQDLRWSSDIPRPLNSVEVQNFDENQGVYNVTVALSYAGGTRDNESMIVYFEDGEFRRHLTEEEISELKQVSTPGPNSTPSDEGSTPSAPATEQQTVPPFEKLFPEDTTGDEGEEI